MTDADPPAEPAGAQYRLFFEAVPCPGWMFDEQTLRIVAVNRAAIRAYGYTRDEFLTMTLDQLSPAGDRPALKRQLRRVKTGAAVGRQRLCCKSGAVVGVMLRWVRTVTRRGRAGTALAWAEPLEDPASSSPESSDPDAFTCAPVALVSVDRGGRILAANDAAVRLVGDAAAALAGRPFLGLVEDGERLAAVLDGDGVDGWSGLLRLRRADGSLIDVEGRAAVHQASGVRILSLQDVSERVRTEGELRRSNDRYRRLSDHSRNLREEERARLSRDIHDRLGQSLTGLKMDLAWLLALCDRFEPTSARSAIAVMMDRIDTTIGIVRRIAGDLRPGVLDRLGLQAAIEWRATEFERRGGVRCRVTSTGEPPALDHLQSTELFRILEEILTNVSRHAKATLVRITMKGERGKFAVHVYDNGRGIPLEAVDSEQSLGLIGMRERATLLGGTLIVSRGRRRGTLVVVRIPVRPRLVGQAPGGAEPPREDE